MYCRNCGKEIREDAPFCQYCGTRQNTQTPQTPQPGEARKRLRGIVAEIVIGGVIAYVALWALHGGLSGKPAATEPPVQQTVPVVTQAPARPPETTRAEPETPENGWYELDGNRYYYKDGERVTGLETIGQHMYYFKDDGVLAVNEDVEEEGYTVEANRDGCVTGLTLDSVSGDWASEKYRMGNGGTSSILELDSELINCDRTGMYIKANGLKGAKVNGTWQIYVRSQGKWVHAKTVTFTEPSGYFELKFDTPMDIDAVTAYPTVRGNASYSAGYLLADAHIVVE